MDVATELILGFGRTLRAVRDREGLSQKELAEGVGISLANVKRYEQENLDVIGPNGFSISIFAKLAVFLDIQPDTLFAEVVSRSDLSDSDGNRKDSQVTKILEAASKKTIEGLVSLDCNEDPPFHNNLSWSLDMAARLGQLSNRTKSEIGQMILEEQVKAGLVEKSEITEQLKNLFSYRLSND